MIAIEFQEETEENATNLKLKAIAERLRSLAKRVPEHPYVCTQLLDIAHELEAAERGQPKGDISKEEKRRAEG